jgi:hypothetical protein
MNKPNDSSQINSSRFNNQNLNNTNQTFNEITDQLVSTLENTDLNEQSQSTFIFSPSLSSSQSYSNLLLIFKLSISLLTFLLFLMSIANLYLLYSNRLTKGGFGVNQVNISGAQLESKRVSLRNFGYFRRPRENLVGFTRENNVSDQNQF